jgi:hypothetical protein
MGWPQSNQQTGFIGYPQNQLFSADDLRYMRDTQRQFLDYGNWQPGMTRTSQFMTDPIFNNEAQAPLLDYEQRQLDQYYQRVGTPAEQSQRQGYWQQMGGQVYGGVIPLPRDPITNEINPAPTDPWSQLNSMGISSAYAMPMSQQAAYARQNATPGGGQDPTEQFSNMPFPNSNYGIPESFSPVTPNYSQQNFSQQQAPAATPPSPWGNNNGSRGSPWGNPGNWSGPTTGWGDQSSGWGW